MSSHKAALQGADHKRVPTMLILIQPIIGHEFAGVILEVGKKMAIQNQVRAEILYSTCYEPYGYS